MKKILITLLMMLSLGIGAQAGKPRQNTQLRTLVASYRGTEGFQVVDLGGAALGLMKAAARSAAETEEDRQALEVLRGLKRFTVVDFSDAPEHVRESFLRKANRILADGEMLMEAKSDGETVRIFGGSTRDENLLEDIVILSEDALVCIRGTIRADQIEALMQQADQ